MIVEDQLLIALDLQWLFESWGCRVIGPAASVDAALRLLETELPSMALLDVNLGNEFVTPVAEYLRDRNIPFALASAYDKLDGLGSKALSGAPNVGKPTSEKRLLAVMSQLVAD